MSRLCRVWRYNRIDATGVFSSWVTALMNAPCCSFRRISRTRKIVLSTTPVMISGKARTPRISIPAWRQLTMTQPMLSASAPADRQTPRTMKNAMDFRRPPDVIRHSIAARGESLASHRDGRGAPGSPTRQPRWGPRPAGKARRPRIPGVFERGATQPAGMHRSTNAARLSPRAAQNELGGDLFFVRLGHLRGPDVPDEPEGLEEPQREPRGVELVPSQAVAGRDRVGVVVVVPAFAKREQRHPPRVLRVVLRGEAPAPPHVRGGVDEPGCVEPDYDAEEDYPVDERPATDREQGNPQHRQRHPVIRRQLAVEGVAREIGCVARHQRRVVVSGFTEDHPAHVRPEAIDARRMRVERPVRVLMVLAMHGHPEDRSALERQRPADRQEVFEQLRGLEPAMRVQPMIPHAEPQTDGHPIEDGRDNQVGPWKRETGGNRLHMEPHQDDACQPIDSAISRQVWAASLGSLVP